MATEDLTQMSADTARALQWVNTLEGRLRRRIKGSNGVWCPGSGDAGARGHYTDGLQHYDDYFEGKHNLAFATPKFRSAFGDVLAAIADNWCRIVVEATAERQGVSGFRIPTEEPGDDAATGDRTAAEIWQANGMDAESVLVHTEKLINGISYVLVDPFVEDGEIPEITGEHPSQMIHAYTPGSRKKVAAALKLWQDDDGGELATLYMPDSIWKFRASAVGQSGLVLPSGESFNRWAPREVNEEAWPLPNPIGVVPVVPFENRPRMLKPGVSEIKDTIPNQDAVNKLLADMMVGSEFSAFRQRYAIGLPVEVDKVTGKPLVKFDIGQDRILLIERGKNGQQVEVGEFDVSPLANYIEAMKNRVEAIAAQSRVPAHYFGLVGQWPSGEALKSAEAGLVKKVLQKALFDGESWERVIRYAFAAMRDPRAKVQNSETIWLDPESRSEAVTVDAALKKAQIGVPWHQLMEDLGYSQAQIKRMEQLRAQEAERPVPAEAA